jgi:hypothetical protein
MELHDRDHVAFSSRVAGREFIGSVVEVESSGHWCECSDTLSRLGVTGKEASEASAIRLSSGVDTRWIDAVCGQKLVDKLEGEFHIVNVCRGVGVTLPLLGSLFNALEECQSRPRLFEIDKAYRNALGEYRDPFESVRGIRELRQLLLELHILAPSMVRENQGYWNTIVIGLGYANTVFSWSMSALAVDGLILGFA